MQISLQQKAQAETALQTLLEDPLSKPTSSMVSGSNNEEVEKLKDQIFSLELKLRNLKDEHAKEIQGLKESMGMEREERPVLEHREQTTVEMQNTGGDTEETETTRMEYQIELPELTDPQEAEMLLEKQIAEQTDEVVKRTMEWELSILQSANVAYLKHGSARSDYHTKRLPYPLLKQETLQWRKENLPDCPEEELGGYAPIMLPYYGSDVCEHT